MHIIYLINNNFEIEITLNFKDNNFFYKNKYFNFIINDKESILIIWNDNNKEQYKTKDSYLYFIDIELEKFYKKIDLIHNDWIDNAILNYKKKLIFRIKNKNINNFNINNNNLYINWNNLKEEIFIKYDDYTYIIDNYIITPNIITKINPPLHIFIHVCCIENWKYIFEDQINYLKISGLYDKCKKIHLGILDSNSEFNYNDDKFDIMYIDKRNNLYETITINFIKDICSFIDYEIYILYIHTKGVRKAGNEIVINSWRKMMEYFLIEKYVDCINNLNIYDAIGCNILNNHCYDFNKVNVNKNHTIHFSGNFWWSKKSNIDNLTKLDIDISNEAFNTRYRAENWICSNYPKSKIGIIFQDNTNIHPYHKYVFDNYKEMKILIKELTEYNI